MSKRLENIKNYYFANPQVAGKPNQANMIQKNLGYAISPVQFVRIRQDIGSWREAINEAELAYYPHRVKMQRVFQDTILNEHLIACMERRKDLTLLRDFKICDEKGEESEDLKSMFRNKITGIIDANVNSASWFDDFISYALDALAFGYSLIGLGDVINDSYPDINIIQRQNISPDRLTVGTLVYQIDGKRFLEDPFVDWHVWITTPSKLGKSKCGYGYLYDVAKAEIYLRNNMAHNADYNEVFGQPIRKGTTTKDGEERSNFEAALRNMGSSAYILLDEATDNVELIESSTAGRSYLTYEDFEKRNEQKISKVILGHADALDSVPGKLGNSNEGSPAEQALSDKQSKDGIFIENIVNTQLLPRMRKHGFKIPLNYRFEYKNDQEKEEFRRREDDSNTKTAELFKTISDAGGKLGKDSWKYFSDRTGIPVEVPEEQPQPDIQNPDVQQQAAALQQQKEQATSEVQKNQIDRKIKALLNKS